MRTLLAIEDCSRLFGSLSTNAQCTRRAVMRCVKRGLAQSVGTVSMMDADGYFCDPERTVEGFALTEAGRDLLRANGHDADDLS